MPLPADAHIGSVSLTEAHTIERRQVADAGTGVVVGLIGG